MAEEFDVHYTTVRDWARYYKKGWQQHLPWQFVTAEE